jgi:hypothetical protein
MWASVIEGVSLNLFCFSFEFFTAVMGPLILALMGIAMVPTPPFQGSLSLELSPLTGWLVMGEGGLMSWLAILM